MVEQVVDYLDGWTGCLSSWWLNKLLTILMVEQVSDELDGWTVFWPSWWLNRLLTNMIVELSWWLNRLLTILMVKQDAYHLDGWTSCRPSWWLKILSSIVSLFIWLNWFFPNLLLVDMFLLCIQRFFSKSFSNSVIFIFWWIWLHKLKL